ncbi:MAG TPA: L-threonine 3-dehydrogenase [Syntrophomonadaceae bacterium]|nr:L-threonine 3-dehydrogenase [Syntrophomonadaceae bacterium]
MKAIVKNEAGAGAVLKEVKIPEIGPHDVLVEAEAVSICGTDLHIYNWDNWSANRIKPPLIIGHEIAGKIVEVGGEVEDWKVGDYVSVECHKICGQCYQCRTGQSHLCRNYSILGVDFDGVFADYVKVPATNLWRNKESLPPEVASLQDPIGNAVLTTLSHDISTKTVIVMGCGAIGMFCVGIATAAGAEKIYAVDVNDYRLSIAEKMGAAVVINALRTDVVDAIMEDTGGEGVDILLEMSGNAGALKNGLKLVKNGGSVSLLSVYPEEVCIDLSNDVVFKGLTIKGITGRRMWDTWYKTAALLNSGSLDVSPIITHKLPMERFEEGFQAMNAGECGKVILYP